MANDKKILSLLQERSEQAIPALSGKYGRLCLSIARSVLGSEQDAQECVADTFLAVWNQLPPDAPTSLGAYITRIVRNAASHDPDVMIALVHWGSKGSTQPSKSQNKICT